MRYSLLKAPALRRALAATALVLGSTAALHAQVKLGGNPATLDTSAVLELSSTNKGFLPPRLTQSQISAISNPAIWLLAVCTDCPVPGLQIYNGSAWVALGAAAAQAATLTANSLSCTGTLSGTYQQGLATTASNTKQVTIGVAAGGTYSIKTDTVNGVSFAGSGTTNTAGANTITLTASGTPAAAGSFTYTTSVSGQPSCTFSVTYSAAATFGTPTNNLPSTLTNGQSYTTSNAVTIPYTGGNGQAYGSTSITQSGLTLTRVAGTYNAGSGTVAYNLSGTYTGASGTSVTFTLPEGVSVTAGAATYAASSLSCSGTLSGTYQQGVATTSSNTKVVSISVSSTGGYSASTNTVNGVTFAGSGTFNGTGTQNATLTASGTPAAAGTFTYTVTLGSQTCTFSVTYTAAATFQFGNATSSFSPTGTLVNGQAYSGTYTLPYTAGNGQAYPSTTVGPQNGLTLTRTAGTYASGGGNVVYTLSGTYTGSATSEMFTLPEGGVIGIPSRYVSTFAGSGTNGYADGTGTAAQFGGPSGLAVDSSGNVYVAEIANKLIRKITPAGVVSTFAGSGTIGSANGTGTAAQFYDPTGAALDGSGNLYVAEYGGSRIRKITPAGVVSTLAGSGNLGFADGTGTAAQFYNPYSVAVDGSGNVYVADGGNNRIRKITPAGVVSTFAGSGTQGSADGTGTAAQFNTPRGIAVDGSGNVYVGDYGNNRIRKITPAGVVSTFAGSTQGSADGTGTAAQFNSPTSVALDGSGNVYVADIGNHRIRKITPAGVVTTYAGSSQGFANGTGTAAQFSNPVGVAVDANGNVYVSDQSNYRIRKITP